MYYRQKILLAIIEECGGSLSNTDFEKLLFLYCKKTNSNHFSFFPYRYGPFSFVSYADKRKLIESGKLADEEGFILLPTSKTHFHQLKDIDKIAIKVFIAQNRNLRGRKLIHTVYLEYPEFARKSEIAYKILSAEEFQQASIFWKENTNPSLLSIGYEGISIDAYLNKLIENDVNALVDVRKNPISRKFGFSKKALGNYVQKAGMVYYHLPELGIPSELRRDLDNVESYRSLFIKYERHILPKQTQALEIVRNLLTIHKRIALSCFEADYLMCHRHKVVDALRNDLPSTINIQHI